ncbi:MAG: rRNA maturation RNase YbeY [Rickettsiaceae bacterium]|nr:rRNA maturation RNase YbeY [Rickettsiaceae bacterium]
MKITVEIAFAEQEWDSYPEINKKQISLVVSDIMQRYKNFAKVQEFELSVLLTNNKQMQDLNKKFRQKDATTNVLSFSDVPIHWEQILEFEPYLDYMYLGDVAFGYETIKAEAAVAGIKFMDHFVHLLIHSILHLIGYDHMDDHSATIMQDLEIEILKRFSIASPY